MKQQQQEQQQQQQTSSAAAPSSSSSKENSNYKHVKAFVFTGDRNQGKPDFVGAFDPEAKAFMKLHNIPAECRLKVDLGKSEQGRRKQVVDFVNDLVSKGFRTNSFAFFCHGFANRVELGFKIANIPELIKLADLAVGEDKDITGIFTVPLYCCSTGDGPGKDGDNGFADKLRDALCAAGYVDCVVDAHVTAGHTTQNSMKRRYMGLGSVYGGTGGLWISGPKTPLWPKWRKALQTNFRFEFPYLEIREIHEYLANNIK